jgi:hypothetical protein
MPRVLASLLVFLMTVALVARGVAAPLMHLHTDVPVSSTPITVAHDEPDHADCEEIAIEDGAGAVGGALAHSHASHSKGKSAPVDHGKVCDTNGACCGPLVLSKSPDGVFGLVARPEPSQTAVSAGVKPLDPDRPPSPPIA